MRQIVAAVELCAGEVVLDVGTGVGVLNSMIVLNELVLDGPLTEEKRPDLEIMQKSAVSLPQARARSTTLRLAYCISAL